MNIGIVAHVDAGKTTVTENILQLCGIIRQAGRVDHGDTLTDSMELERKKGISIKATPISFMYKDTKINLIDTPGHVDFVSEVERALSVLDGVVLIVSAKEGIQSQTKILVKTIRDLQIPCIVFVNKADRLGVDIKNVLSEVSKNFLGKTINMQGIEKEGTKDVLLRPRSYEELVEEAVELLCDLDESILEKYIGVSPSPVSLDYLYDRLQYFTKQANIYPVFMGSALHGLGVRDLLDAIVNFLPLSIENDNAPLSALVFKIDNNISAKDKKVYVRIFQGGIKIRESIAFHDTTEKVKNLRALENGKVVNKDYIGSGDICILTIKDLKVADIIGEKTEAIKKISIASPALRVQVQPKNPANKRRLYETLFALSEEDPMMDFSGDVRGDKMYLNLFGEVQMEIITLLLQEQYNLDIEFSNLLTIYKETPTEKASAITRIYSGGNHFCAGIGFEIEPLPRGQGLQYESKVSFGSLEKPFQNAVEEAVWKSCKNGVYGLEITDAKVVFAFSQYSSVESTPADYRNLAPLVLMEAFSNSSMQMLEPILEFELVLPEHAASRALYDCRKMNADIWETKNGNGEFIITGLVPVETSKHYKLLLASYTEGCGIFITKLYGYKETEFDENKIDKDNVNPATNKGLYLLQKFQ
ncbi:translation elongation factor g-related [Holotrichia oblita]|nr:translation elongation factor g-related [Holotrichia oblita]